MKQYVLSCPRINIPALTQRNFAIISRSASRRPVRDICARKLVANGFVDARFQCCFPLAYYLPGGIEIERPTRIGSSVAVV
jgi:hypothetical protein